MTPDTHCNRELLEKLLTESLSERDESDASEHLSQCPTCRQEFEVLAAANDWWAEASQRLSHRADRRGTIANITGPDDDDDDWPATFSTDFAVDFLEPSDDATALGRLGEYEIVEVIGRGGMGVVLKGFQKELHRYVAVKVLSPHLATSGAARRRFAREAQATAAVVHPHVMAIHSVNANVRLPYLVMPFVDCESLQQRLDRQGPLDLKDILRIGMQAALGLAAAHAQGLVHRDVKPANILLETNVDRVLLTDFGLARAVDDATLTRTGIIAGTPQYMSPEQANGDGVDHRSDLFSLGSVLYAMCTARPPFRAESTFGVLRRIRETSARSIREINGDVPEWLERIIERLLSKDAGARFGSAQEVATLLEQCLAHQQQPTTNPLPALVGDWPLLPSAQTRDQRTGSQQRRLAAIVIATMVLLTGFYHAWKSATTPLPQEQGAAISRHSSPAASDASGSKQADAPGWNELNDELDRTESLIDELESSHGDDRAVQGANR